MIRKRIISFLLTLAIVFSFCVSASASSASSDRSITDMDSVNAWKDWANVNKIASVPIVDVVSTLFSVFDVCIHAAGVGAVDSLALLQNRAASWNSRLNKADTWALMVAYLLYYNEAKTPFATVAFDDSLGVYRLRDSTTGLWLVSSSGQFPFYCPSIDEVPAEYLDFFIESTRKDTWLPFSQATSAKQVSVLTKDSLSDLAVTINQTDRTCSVRDTYINDKSFYVIIDTSNNIYANADGVPYVAHYEATVTDQKYDYIINEGDTLNEGDTIYNDNSTIIEGSTTNYEIVDNSQVIDLSNGSFTYIGEQSSETFNIDELIYDFSTQTYSADTYNVTYDNDQYTTNNFLFHTTYNITNVYVTNIGQTELYEPLELYYVLPDGRSSADLTAEEIAGMSFEFADCVNYAKSATDTYLRALYHFDGNTDDSSYFSTQGKFEWLSGASISYMDVGTFGGALYLGPESHEFNITLPSNIGSGDYTLQFRYYQAGAADTIDNQENIINLEGGSDFQFNWDDSHMYRGSATDPICELPLGTWNEIAIIRHNGTLRYYLNGISVSSGASTIVNGNEITFIFGNTSRAYSMIDELRVLNFAFAEDGAAYTCTSVPYDTNAVLVLPDSAFPIADEYWNIKSSGTNILSQYGLDDWTGSMTSLPSYFSGKNFYTSTKVVSTESPDGYYWGDNISTGTEFSAFPYFYYTPANFSFSSYADGFQFQRKVSFSALNYLYSYSHGCWVGLSWNTGNGPTAIPTYGVFSILASDAGTTQALAKGTYTFSLVNNSGEVASVTFALPKVSGSFSSTTGTDKKTTNTAFGYEFGLLRLVTRDTAGWCGYTYFLVVTPVEDDPDLIMHMELVNGSTTDLAAEWVTCMYSSEEVQPNTAAIQTDIPLNGYTVGGVRPTFPARGDCWMPVSNKRITNVYVYNGSAWEEVNARWYTGSRWIPIYAFDIITLEDCWDIADIDTTIVMIGSELQFWSWLQNAWQKMLDKLDAIIIALGGDPNYTPDGSGGSGGSGLWDRLKTVFTDALATIIEDIMTFITDVLKLVLDLVYDLLSFFFDFLSTQVIDGIGNLFAVFTDGSLLVFFQQDSTSTDEDGNEVTTTIIALPEGVATVFAFFAGVIMILPEELRSLLIFGVGALILIGIFKLAKS